MQKHCKRILDACDAGKASWAICEEDLPLMMVLHNARKIARHSGCSGSRFVALLGPRALCYKRTAVIKHANRRVGGSRRRPKL